MQGLLGGLPPGLAGFVAQRQMAGQEQNQQLQQAQGLLSMQQAQQQQGLLAQQMADKQKQQAQIEAFANTLPPEVRPRFLANPPAYFQEMNKRHVVDGNLVDNSGVPLYRAQPKPQLTEVGVEGKPGVTQRVWVTPGVPDITPIGAPKMPEILNPEVQAAKGKIAAMGASRNVTNVNMPGDNKYIDARRADQAKGFGELEKAANSAYNQFSTLDRFIQASEKGFAGGAAPLFAGAANLLSSFGIPVAADKLKDTRIMEQAIGDILGNKMAELGARGLTDKDMEILRQNLPRVEIDKASRVAVANILKKSNANTLREYENARNEEAKNFPELAARSPTPAWYKDYQANKVKFGGAPQPAQSPAPAGIDPKVWNAMTPEEKALWQN